MSQLVGIYGANGFGCEVMSVARQSVGRGVTICFVDDGPSASTINGLEVLSWDEFLAFPASQRQMAVAIADGNVRRRLTQKCASANVAQFEVRANNTVVGDAVVLGEGSILQPFTILTANCTIGRGFHANIYSYVAHDCVIGDYVTFAPGVKCNGNVHIEDHAYIGTGAILKQGRPGAPLIIGRGAVVGMGAVVTKDVAQGATVVGNPAKPLVRS